MDWTPHFHTVGRCVKHVTAWSYSLRKLPLTGSPGCWGPSVGRLRHAVRAKAVGALGACRAVSV
jgi:hypothetical protein